MAIPGSSSRLSLMIQRTSIRNSSRARISENRRMLRGGILNRVLRGRGDQHDSSEAKRPYTHTGRGSSDAAAVYPQRRSGTPRSEIRLRTRSMRLLHGHCQGSGNPVLCHAGIECRGRGDHDARRFGIEREAASDSKSVHRRAGRAVWLLPQRRDHDRKSPPGPESQSIRCGHSAGAVGGALPVPHAYAHDAGHQTLRSGGESMNRSNPINRRTFLKTSGALVVTFSLAPESLFSQRLDGASSNQVDGWLSITADGSVTAFTGKCELGHGLYTAQTQLVAEELSVPLNRVKLVQCDTEITPDQGTTSGAQSHPTNFNHGSLALACATAREALIRLAATRLGIPADQLSAKDGVISAKSDPTRKVSYGELIGGKKFNLTLDNRAKRKPASEWTTLGTPVPRIEIPAMATGEV